MNSVIANNRFGLGVKPSDSKIDSKEFLLSQISNFNPKPDALNSIANTSELMRSFSEYQIQKKEAKNNNIQQRENEERQFLRKNVLASVNARTEIALNSQTPFMERLVHFWSNHFAISNEKLAVRALAGPYEFEAIRPNINKTFLDLLLAADTHPAMLLYLDQTRSIGPNSPQGKRVNARNEDKKIGINENLAREILELHTLGVNGGYNQNDVTEFAKAMTGLTIVRERKTPSNQNLSYGASYFEPLMHEEGPRQILGKNYRNFGNIQYVEILKDVCKHPSTAKFIAFKLARHFAGDNPPQSLVNKLTNEFTRTNGDLKSLYAVLINADEIWAVNNANQQSLLKFKTPWEWLVSSLRALNYTSVKNMDINGLMTNLGQTVWQPKAPKGYDDTESAWAAPDALMRRVEFISGLTGRIKQDIKPVELAQTILGDSLSSHTKTAISRAESQQSGLSLLFLSPEFLRR